MDRRARFRMNQLPKGLVSEWAKIVNESCGYIRQRAIRFQRSNSNNDWQLANNTPK
jgi:hypothetical protein